MIRVNRFYHPLGIVSRAFRSIAAATVRCVDGERCDEMNESPRFTGFGPIDYVEFDGPFCPDCGEHLLDCQCLPGERR